ncbi:hypothetical protein [Nocardioides dongkuii]|uniref:hypothetical protein n=1 Tax=Nocardioides dongkuii TaxID=2760089 RepID=UPI0015FB4E85|nr:hypothetical protein [Nocardioides dongkuii]
MSDTASTRPRQVTVAASLIMAGSVLLVIAVFDQIAGLRSLETREAVEDFLADPPGEGLGLSVNGVLDILRVGSMVAAACATAAVILGTQVLRRSRAARIALSVLAVPLLLTGLVAGGFLSSVVAVSVAMLWMQPSRDWFDGIERREPERATPESRPAEVTHEHATHEHVREPVAHGSAGASQPQVVVPPQGEARAYPGFGTAAAAHPEALGRPGQPGQPTQVGGPERRPPAVVWACALTWTFAGLVAVGMLLTAVVILLTPDLVMDEVRRQEPAMAEDLSEDLLVGTTVVMAGILVVWCTVAAVFAWFAFRRAGWARVALLVSAAVAGAGCLAGVLVGSFPLLVPMIGSAVTTALLARPEVRRWYAGRGTI